MILAKKDSSNKNNAEVGKKISDGVGMYLEIG